MVAAERRTRAGRWLREARKKAGYETTTDFAQAINVHQGTVSAYEIGRQSVDEERVEDIARALGLDVIDVRRGLGMWVPAGLEPRAMTPEEAVKADDSLTDAGRTLVLDVLRSLRLAKGSAL